MLTIEVVFVGGIKEGDGTRGDGQEEVLSFLQADAERSGVLPIVGFETRRLDHGEEVKSFTRRRRHCGYDGQCTLST